jgi:hypothetical protein
MKIQVHLVLQGAADIFKQQTTALMRWFAKRLVRYPLLTPPESSGMV